MMHVPRRSPTSSSRSTRSHSVLARSYDGDDVCMACARCRPANEWGAYAGHVPQYGWRHAIGRYAEPILSRRGFTLHWILSRVGLLPLEDPLVPEAYLCTVLFEYTSAAGRWLGLQVHVQYTWPQRAPWKEAAGSGSLENVPRQAVLRAYVCTYGGLGGGVAPVSRM